MSLKGKKLLICEEALCDYKGHFYSWIKAIRKIHQEAGATVIVAGNSRILSDIQEELDAIPAFKVNSWSGIYHYPQAWKRYYSVFKHNLQLYRELAAVLRQTGPVDCILFPAVRIHHLMALRALCTFHGGMFHRMVSFILTSEAIYDADYTRFHFKRSSALIRCALKSFSRLVAARTVIFAGDSHVTCGEYTSLSGIPFQVFPSPSAGLHAVDVPTHTADPDAPPCFTILGVSVIEKGMDVLQDAILQLLAQDPGLQARFVIQWGTPTIGYDGKPVPIREELRNAPQVTILDTVLSEEDYQNALHGSDFLVLPYRRNTYFSRLSGVVVEAACAGIPMIVTENTWLDWAMGEYGAGLTTRDGDAGNLAARILKAINTRSELVADARAKAAVALEKNSTKTYLQLVWNMPENRVSPPVLE